MMNQIRKWDCTECKKKNCPHRSTFRRIPKELGGMGLCPNLKGGSEGGHKQ